MVDGWHKAQIDLQGVAGDISGADAQTRLFLGVGGDGQ